MDRIRSLLDDLVQIQQQGRIRQGRVRAELIPLPVDERRPAQVRDVRDTRSSMSHPTGGFSKCGGY